MEVKNSLLYSAAHDDDSEQQQSGTVVNCLKVLLWLFHLLHEGLYCEEEVREEEPANDGIDTDQYLDDLDIEIDILKDDLLLLTESDIPGASLNGKDPSELNVMQLRRWLTCRGAPTPGKKPELIER